MTTWEIGEFKEYLISRKLLEIEQNKVHFWRLCFFEVLGAEIQIFDQQIEFCKIRPISEISVCIIENTMFSL